MSRKKSGDYATEYFDIPRLTKASARVTMATLMNPDYGEYLSANQFFIENFILPEFAPPSNEVKLEASINTISQSFEELVCRRNGINKLPIFLPQLAYILLEELEGHHKDLNKDGHVCKNGYLDKTCENIFFVPQRVNDLQKRTLQTQLTNYCFFKIGETNYLLRSISVESVSEAWYIYASPLSNEDLFILGSKIFSRQSPLKIIQD